MRAASLTVVIVVPNKLPGKCHVSREFWVCSDGRRKINDDVAFIAVFLS